MNVATQAIPTIYGVMSKARKVVVKIIWMIMVIIPTMPLKSETVRVAERLR